MSSLKLLQGFYFQDTCDFFIKTQCFEGMITSVSDFQYEEYEDPDCHSRGSHSFLLFGKNTRYILTYTYLNDRNFVPLQIS